MRILMTADTVGGVWTYALELIRALGEHGVEVSLATMGAPPTSEQRVDLRRIRNVALHESSFKLEWMDDPWEDIRHAGEWLLRIEQRVKPDVVHLNGYVHGALPWKAPVLMVGHSCVLSWWSAVKEGPAPESWSRYGQEVAQGLQAARVVLSPSSAMLTALEQNYGPFRSSGVIHNGRDAALFQPDEKEPFIFTAGRVWDEAKNIAAIESVAPRLKWPAYIAGEDEHPNGAESREWNVKVLGRLAPQVLPYWYGRASIYVLPARYEPFGLSVLEAGLGGCALVLGDIPSLREIWGDAALFVPPDDSDALEAAINSLIDDDSLRGQFSARARAKALEYTPQKMAAGYMRAYRDVQTPTSQNSNREKREEARKTRKTVT